MTPPKCSLALALVAMTVALCSCSQDAAFRYEGMPDPRGFWTIDGAVIDDFTPGEFVDLEGFGGGPAAATLGIVMGDAPDEEWEFLFDRMEELARRAQEMLEKCAGLPEGEEKDRCYAELDDLLHALDLLMIMWDLYWDDLFELFPDVDNMEQYLNEHYGIDLSDSDFGDDPWDAARLLGLAPVDDYRLVGIQVADGTPYFNVWYRESASAAPSRSGGFCDRFGLVPFVIAFDGGWLGCARVMPR